MFETKSYKQRKLEEAYRKGAEKARQTGPWEDALDALGNVILPDSLGAEEYQSYKKGYRDHYTGRVQKPAPTPHNPQKAPALDPSEKAWYALCDRSEFISDEVVRYYQEQLFAHNQQVTFLIGLSDFCSHSCPKCGAEGYFKIHFLGCIRHPDCGWDGYMKTGSYIGHQIGQIFHTGARAAAGMKDQVDRKGESGGWMHGVFGFLFGAVFRAAAAVVVIPLHCMAGLCQSDQTRGDIVTRVVTLLAIPVAIGVVGYEVRQASTMGSATVPPQSQVMSVTPGPRATPPTFRPKSPSSGGSFGFAPDYSNHWTLAEASGNPRVSSLGGKLQVQAPVSGGTARFVAKSSLTGDFDVTFRYNHQGYGRTTVGLWSVPLNNWQALADLDTNDTPCLYLNALNQPGTSLCPSAAYLNRPLALRIQVIRNRIAFYADNSLLHYFDLSGNGPYAPAISVGSRNWKSGDNLTTFYGVSVAKASAAGAVSKVQSRPADAQQQSNRLPVDLAVHCRLHGYAGVRNKDGTGYGWVCTPGDASISVDQACKEQYGNQSSVGLATPPPGGMNDWFCLR